MIPRWRWLLLLCAIPLVVGLGRLRFDTNVLNLLPNDLPTVAGLKLHQQHFANNRELIITVTASDAPGAELAARGIATALQGGNDLVASAVWRPPWLDEPAGTAEFLAWLWLSRPQEEVARMIGRLAPANAAATLEAARERLATSLSPIDLARLGHDPFGLTAFDGATLAVPGQDWFASPDGAFRLIFVQPKTPPKDIRAWGEWLAKVRTLVATAPEAKAAKIGFTGTPVFTVETASAMESDMRQSVLATILLVGALFWWAHRRFWPLAWMLVMLVSSLLAAMAMGGLIFGSLNVVSFGFAAILLGLGVDYALVLYQELLGSPNATAREIRAQAAPGIWWSASTTALAFGLLNFAGLPGLGQLGTLVAIGIMVAATAMIYGFLPLMTRRPPPSTTEARGPSAPPRHRLAWAVTLLAAVVAAAVLTRWSPEIDRSAQPLGNVDSEAARTAKEIDGKMNQGAETLWLIVEGRNETEVGERLARLKTELAGAAVELPLEIWPQPDRQRRNLAAVRGASVDLAALRRAADAAGFTEEALALTESMVHSWASFQPDTGAVWPKRPANRWLVDRVAARAGETHLALGLARVRPEASLATVGTPGVYLAGWSRLAEVLLEKVERRLTLLTAAMALVLAVCLRLALRGWREVALSFAALGFGFALTLLVMAAFGWKWNLLSLTAIPLLLGASVDYTIHVQLALARHHGDARAMRRTIGRALFLVTAAAVAGFASLGLASNAGLASFEIVCAVGMICIFVTSLYLLPAWHYTFATTRKDHA